MAGGGSIFSAGSQLHVAPLYTVTTITDYPTLLLLVPLDVWVVGDKGDACSPLGGNLGGLQGRDGFGLQDLIE